MVDRDLPHDTPTYFVALEFDDGRVAPIRNFFCALCDGRDRDNNRRLTVAQCLVGQSCLTRQALTTMPAGEWCPQPASNTVLRQTRCRPSHWRRRPPSGR